MHSVVGLVEGYWWLVFIIGPFAGGITQNHRRHRLEVIAAKTQLAETKSQALRPAPDPQPICGCSHHLSFHNPHTSACAVDDCRCQHYVGPEPLGYIFAQPLIDPGAAGGHVTDSRRAADSAPHAVDAPIRTPDGPRSTGT